MTKVVKFNVGGQPYQVSRSLLALYPQTMLAKSAAKQWQEDPESEVFIERDGEMFRHVLNYLRDGNVKLPLTVTKDGFLLELVYYGVDGIDEKNVDDSLITASQATQGLVHVDKVCASLESLVKSLTVKKNAAQFAVLSLKHMKYGRFRKCWQVNINSWGKDIDLAQTYKRDEVNAHLIKVGLEIKEWKRPIVTLTQI